MTDLTHWGLAALAALLFAGLLFTVFRYGQSDAFEGHQRLRWGINTDLDPKTWAPRAWALAVLLACALGALHWL